MGEGKSLWKSYVGKCRYTNQNFQCASYMDCVIKILLFGWQINKFLMLKASVGTFPPEDKLY